MHMCVGVIYCIKINSFRKSAENSGKRLIRSERGEIPCPMYQSVAGMQYIMVSFQWRGEGGSHDSKVLLKSSCSD